MTELLDHGYINLVETWGSDERIIEAARMSTGKGFLGWGPKGVECTSRECGWKADHVGHALETPEGPCCPRCTCTIRDIPGDEKLLRYLWDNRHATPFEMAGAVFEIQAPIFVFREWHRHRTQSYNELSARYTPLPDVNYLPTVERLMINVGTSNKQAGTIKGSEELTETSALEFLDDLRVRYQRAEETYQEALKRGVPKELARVVLPVGRYSRMRASANLRNWLGFLTLRMDKNAQWEIRQYANALHDLLKSIFPRTLELFDRTVEK